VQVPTCVGLATVSGFIAALAAGAFTSLWSSGLLGSRPSSVA